MLLKVFTIYDSKAEAFPIPFFRSNRGEAIRDFTDETNKSGSGINRHPEDYTLFEIGTYDDKNARFESLTAPLAVLSALEAYKTPDQTSFSIPRVQPMENRAQ